KIWSGKIARRNKSKFQKRHHFIAYRNGKWSTYRGRSGFDRLFSRSRGTVYYAYPQQMESDLRLVLRSRKEMERPQSVWVPGHRKDERSGDYGRRIAYL